MDKLNPWRTGSALALTAAVTSVICAAAVYLFPDATVAFVNSWMHGLDLAALRSDKPWTLGGLALGLFNATLTGFLAGALFSCCRHLTAGR
ncbi:MAG: DUF5676 family membrane protein [Gammaproteobacteria bacterium]